MKKRMLVLGILILILCVLTVTFAFAENPEGDEGTITVSISPQEPVLGQPLTISWDIQGYENYSDPYMDIMIFSGGMIKYLYPDLGNSLEEKTGSVTFTLTEGESIAADLVFYINGGEEVYGSTGHVPLSGEGNQPDPITVDVSYEVSQDHQITANYQVAGRSDEGYDSIQATWVRFDADGEAYRLHSRNLADTPVGQLTYTPPADGNYALIFDIFDLNDWQFYQTEGSVTETVAVSGTSPQEFGIEFYKELPTVLIPRSEFDLCWDVVGVSDEPKTEISIVTDDGAPVLNSTSWGYSGFKQIKLKSICDESTRLIISLTPMDGNVSGETVTREIPIVAPEMGGIFRFGGYQQLTETVRYYVHPDLQMDRNYLYSSNQYDFVPSGAEILFRSQIENYYDIMDAIISDPEYTVQVTKGNVDFNTNGYQDPSGLTVRLSSMPEPQEAEFEIICTINGRNYSQTVRMEFVLLDSLPTGLVIGQKLPLVFKVGDPFYDLKKVPISFTNNWSVGESRETQIASTNIVFNAVNFNTATPVWSVPGVYRGEVRLILAAENVMMHQTVDVVVTGADGTISVDDYTPFGTVAAVPADLTRIENEAFAGTKLTEIDIPAGVEIAADAFDGTGLVTIYCHDQETVDYALQHGFVAVVE